MIKKKRKKTYRRRLTVEWKISDWNVCCSWCRRWVRDQRWCGHLGMLLSRYTIDTLAASVMETTFFRDSCVFAGASKLFFPYPYWLISSSIQNKPKKKQELSKYDYIRALSAKKRPAFLRFVYISVALGILLLLLQKK